MELVYHLPGCFDDVGVLGFARRRLVEDKDVETKSQDAKGNPQKLPAAKVSGLLSSVLSAKPPWTSANVSKAWSHSRRAPCAFAAPPSLFVSATSSSSKRWSS